MLSKQNLSNLRSLRHELHEQQERLSSMPKQGELCALQQEIKRNTEKMSVLLACLEKEIAAIPDSVARRILRYRFMDGYSWVKIAMILYCDEKTVRRIAGKWLE